MLAGLLFAELEALDRPGTLIATLPFGGGTVIEYQARLLIAAGAAQIIVSVGRLTPELIGALGRIGKRGIVIDTVRSAVEAQARLHPLSTIVMVADGLITTQGLIDGFAKSDTGGDALLVLPTDTAGPDYERLGGQLAWGGVGRIDPRRIAEVAALPNDYALQSSILRLAEQAQAVHVPLALEDVRDGHGLEHSAVAFASRGRMVLAATVADRRDWFNAAILGPIARSVTPKLLDRHIATEAVVGGGVAVGLTGLATEAFGPGWLGLALVLVGVLALGVARVLAALRDEERLAQVGRLGTLTLPALAFAVAGVVVGSGGGVAPLLAGGLLFLGGLAERAIRRDRRRRWWGGPPAYLLAATLGAVIGWPIAGLGLAAAYAAATLTAAVESLREKA
jgi:hypothetical protein